MASHIRNRRHESNLGASELAHLRALFDSGLKPKSIHDQWYSLGFMRGRDPVSISHLYRLKQVFDLHEQFTEPNSPIDWRWTVAKMDRLATESFFPAPPPSPIRETDLPYLRSIEAFKRDAFTRGDNRSLIFTGVDPMLAACISHIRTYAPEVVHPLDLWTLAGRFTYRYQILNNNRIPVGQRVAFPDLDALLDFRPWLSAARHERYKRAVNYDSKLILQPFRPGISDLSEGEADEEGILDSVPKAPQGGFITYTGPYDGWTFLSNLTWFFATAGHLLPSQWGTQPFTVQTAPASPNKYIITVPGAGNVQKHMRRTRLSQNDEW